jgi:hypothetical protein
MLSKLRHTICGKYVFIKLQEKCEDAKRVIRSCISKKGRKCIAPKDQKPYIEEG